MPSRIHPSRCYHCAPWRQEPARSAKSASIPLPKTRLLGCLVRARGKRTGGRTSNVMRLAVERAKLGGYRRGHEDGKRRAVNWDVSRAPDPTPNGRKLTEGAWCLPLQTHVVSRRNPLRPLARDLYSYLETIWRTGCLQPTLFAVKRRPQKALAA